MAITKISRERIEALVTEAFDRYRPRTQQQCCDIAAQISVLCDDGPWTDAHVLNVACSMADGLFGPSFSAADYGQRSAWIDMCEAALRRAIV